MATITNVKTDTSLNDFLESNDIFDDQMKCLVCNIFEQLGLAEIKIIETQEIDGSKTDYRIYFSSYELQKLIKENKYYELDDGDGDAVDEDEDDEEDEEKEDEDDE